MNTGFRLSGTFFIHIAPKRHNFLIQPQQQWSISTEKDKHKNRYCRKNYVKDVRVLGQKNFSKLQMTLVIYKWLRSKVLPNIETDFMYYFRRIIQWIPSKLLVTVNKTVSFKTDQYRASFQHLEQFNIKIQNIYCSEKAKLEKFVLPIQKTF